MKFVGIRTTRIYYQPRNLLYESTSRNLAVPAVNFVIFIAEVYENFIRFS